MKKYKVVVRRTEEAVTEVEATSEIDAAWKGLAKVEDEHIEFKKVDGEIIPREIK